MNKLMKVRQKDKSPKGEQVIYLASRLIYGGSG